MRRGQLLSFAWIFVAALLATPSEGAEFDVSVITNAERPHSGPIVADFDGETVALVHDRRSTRVHSLSAPLTPVWQTTRNLDASTMAVSPEGLWLVLADPVPLPRVDILLLRDLTSQAQLVASLPWQAEQVTSGGHADGIDVVTLGGSGARVSSVTSQGEPKSQVLPITPRAIGTPARFEGRVFVPSLSPRHRVDSVDEAGFWRNDFKSSDPTFTGGPQAPLPETPPSIAPRADALHILWSAVRAGDPLGHTSVYYLTQPWDGSVATRQLVSDPDANAGWPALSVGATSWTATYLQGRVSPGLTAPATVDERTQLPWDIVSTVQEDGGPRSTRLVDDSVHRGAVCPAGCLAGRPAASVYMLPFEAYPTGIGQTISRDGATVIVYADTSAINNEGLIQIKAASSQAS
jgi:hypothetical protein